MAFGCNGASSRGPVLTAKRLYPGESRWVFAARAPVGAHCAAFHRLQRLSADCSNDSVPILLTTEFCVFGLGCGDSSCDFQAGAGFFIAVG